MDERPLSPGELDDLLRRVLARAFLYNDPDSFRSGVEETVQLLMQIVGPARATA